MRFYYTLTTIDPVVLSQSNASTDNHQCLEYIPGSVILGCLASKLYRTLSSEQSWYAFQSGQVCFANCYPVIDGQGTLPQPLSWVAQDNLVTNRAAKSYVFAGTKGKKQARNSGRFINPKNTQAHVVMDVSTKTAIDAVTGLARESHLYNYAHIEPAQQFIGWVDCPDQRLAQLLFDALDQTHRIGRSRNSEFGRVRLMPLKTQQAQMEVSNLGQKLVLWCLSDAELYDSRGLPTLRPMGCDIHPELTDAKLDRAKSFIKSQCVSRFNQKRQGEDSEQVMLAMGSVMVFELSKPLPDALLQQIQQQGIGASRQQGLGWVYVNPPWADVEKIAGSELFASIEIPSKKATKTTAQAFNKPMLISWLEHKQQCSNELQNTEIWQALYDVTQYYQKGREYNSLGIRDNVGPTLTQWHRLFTLVKEKDDWLSEAFSGAHAICKVENDNQGWGLSWQESGSMMTLAGGLERLLKDKSPAFIRALLQRLIRYDLSRKDELNQCKVAIEKELSL